MCMNPDCCNAHQQDCFESNHTLLRDLYIGMIGIIHLIFAVYLLIYH